MHTTLFLEGDDGVGDMDSFENAGEHFALFVEISVFQVLFLVSFGWKKDIKSFCLLREEDSLKVALEVFLGNFLKLLKLSRLSREMVLVCLNLVPESATFVIQADVLFFKFGLDSFSLGLELLLSDFLDLGSLLKHKLIDGLDDVFARLFGRLNDKLVANAVLMAHVSAVDNVT